MSINKGLLIDDKKPNGYFMKGVAYKHIGDSAKAISSFKTAIEIDHNYYPVYYELGLLLTLKKDSLALSNHSLPVQRFEELPLIEPIITIIITMIATIATKIVFFFLFCSE